MQLLLDASKRPPTADGCAAALLEALPAVMWFVRRHMRYHRTRGLSVPQFRTLVLLRRYPLASLSAVKDHLGSSLPTASRIVGGLVSKGLIKRKASQEDRRQISLELTERGNSVLDEAWQATRSVVAEKLGNLSDNQRASMMATLTTLAELFHTNSPVPDETLAE